MFSSQAHTRGGCSPSSKHTPCDEVLCDACHVPQQAVCTCWPVADGPSTPPIQLIQLTCRGETGETDTEKQQSTRKTAVRCCDERQ
jgi:hypothetical protein